MVEVFLLVLVGILGGRLSDLINLDPIVITILVLILTFALAAIAAYRYRIADRKTVLLSFPTVRFTQQGVRQLMWWAAYGPSAALLSFGAYNLSELLERGFLVWLSTIAVSGTIFAWPVFRQQARAEGRKFTAILIAWLLSLVYGGAGWMLVVLPDLFKTYWLVFVTISAVTMTGLKYAYIFDLVINYFDPWFQKLPAK